MMPLYNFSDNTVRMSKEYYEQLCKKASEIPRYGTDNGGLYMGNPTIRGSFDEAMHKATTAATAYTAGSEGSFSEEPRITGGTKYDSNKPGYHLIASEALEQLALVLDYGARKYAPHNWRKGIHYSRLIRAALGHILAFNSGETNDPETGLSHIAHAMCNCMFILATSNEWDDRMR